MWCHVTVSGGRTGHHHFGTVLAAVARAQDRVQQHLRFVSIRSLSSSLTLSIYLSHSLSFSLTLSLFLNHSFSITLSLFFSLLSLTSHSHQLVLASAPAPAPTYTELRVRHQPTSITADLHASYEGKQWALFSSRESLLTTVTLPLPHPKQQVDVHTPLMYSIALSCLSRGSHWYTCKHSHSHSCRHIQHNIFLLLTTLPLILPNTERLLHYRTVCRHPQSSLWAHHFQRT